ncbi:MAG: hypothetical protein JWQ46_116, partial [Phenylobacterium sp.]|nr:hypothetical protein [Phenylobacterium sp.]
MLKTAIREAEKKDGRDGLKAALSR